MGVQLFHTTSHLIVRAQFQVEKSKHKELILLCEIPNLITVLITNIHNKVYSCQ